MRNRKLIVLLSVVVVLILSVVICSATFLVRDVDAYSYYKNGDTEEYKNGVVAAAGIEMNGSIFFVHEDEVKARVENIYPNINVVNVKRSFPDRVTINFVVYEKLFQYRFGNEYYQCYSSCRIGETATEPLNGIITVKPRDEINTKIGAYFQNSDGYDRKMLQVFIDFMRRKGFSDESLMIQFAEFIDFRRDGYVYIKTNAGCCIEAHCDASSFYNCLELAYSAYVNPETVVGDQTRGRYLVSASSDKIVYTRPGVGSYPEDEAEYYRQWYEAA